MTQAVVDITIVGLGPGDPMLWTPIVQNTLEAAKRLFVRGHPNVDLTELLSRQDATDVATLHDPDANAAHRWKAAAIAICDAADERPVVLAIPGHPRFGEGLVADTCAEADRRGLTTQVLDGISVVDLIATALGIDPMLESVQLFNARIVEKDIADATFSGGRFTGSPRRPMLFTHVYNSETCTTIAQVLRRILPLNHPVSRIEAAGMPNQDISEHTVDELAGIASGPLVALWVPAMDTLEAVRDPRTLQHIVARLRAPDGCPWDRKQTYVTLRNSLIDEVYEVIDAIDSGDYTNLVEELGDLFLLICMHAQVAEENGTFTLEDVFAGISTKIVRRHPHVFGDAVAQDASAVVGLWNEIKDQERADDPGKPEKAQDGQPFSMPTLTRATRILAKHPLPDSSGNIAPSAETRSTQLLVAIDAIIAAGDDPEVVLRNALAAHINSTPND